MRHSPNLMSNKRRSAELRAKYGYFRHIWLAEGPRAATVTVQRQVLFLSTWPSGIRQSLAHGPDRLLRAMEQVLYPLLLIGMAIASACRKRLEDQLKPVRLSRLLSVARQGQGLKDSPGLLARIWSPGSRCMRHRCPSVWRARRRRSGLGDRPGWAGPRARRPTVAIQAVASTRPSSALHCPIGRRAAGRRERSPGTWRLRRSGPAKNRKAALP